MSWREVSAQARADGTKAFIGDIMPLAYQKHSEIIGDDPKKVYKGRIVYRGDAIKDEFFEWALFGEVASSPSSMAASKVADFWGALPGHAVQYSDAEMSYTQAVMGGDPTYVRLPKTWWPKSDHNFGQEQHEIRTCKLPSVNCCIHHAPGAEFHIMADSCFV